ncbi:DUF4345 family protein [Embleya sp. AB8]|uniref:DUF4345 family protein n=1 Tax=Embleya sp. AB8 TaxID=3156304 RepID=UPI003C75D40F
MNPGRVSSAVLMVSGIAFVAMPEQAGAALDLAPSSSRGVTEIRAALGGTFAALGAWALVTPDPAVRRAVGAVWLGAAATRLVALRVDHPRTDRSFWGYLGLEIACGAAALTRP